MGLNGIKFIEYMKLMNIAECCGTVFYALSRHQQGFESPTGRQLYQWVRALMAPTGDSGDIFARNLTK